MRPFSTRGHPLHARPSLHSPKRPPRPAPPLPVVPASVAEAKAQRAQYLETAHAHYTTHLHALASHRAALAARIEQRQAARFAARGEFLRERCRMADECKEALEKLIDAYIEAEKQVTTTAPLCPPMCPPPHALRALCDRAAAQDIHEDDIAYMKKELTDEECVVVMKASKLIELCEKRGLEGLSPPTVRTSAFPYQTIADADIFGACHLFILRPNPKPTAHFATLPGTGRRPLKPWQMCTEEEKTLEIAVACTLDR